MSKEVKFNIKLQVDGKEHVVSATTDIQKLVNEFDNAQTNATKLRNALIKYNQVGESLKSVLSSLQQLTGFMQSYTQASAIQVEAETKLATVMRNTMGAREEDIQSIKDLCSEQQKLGVIGDEVQLAGAQKLAT
jgi:division protein CdvB (Snf7/Vps24/ESCRT-III family)